MAPTASAVASHPRDDHPQDEHPNDDAKHGAIGHLSADDELQQAVCEALIADSELDSSDIGVRIAHDTVTLSGSVANREARSRALLIAKAQRGVASVQDELSIRDA
jgi:osmotically-inducible protein OsmY